MPVNNELLEALDAMQKERNKENAGRLTQLLDKAVVLVPAVMPKNTDPAVLKHMAQNPGRQMPIPKGAQPSPCILQNSEGKKFFPVFTSEEEMEKGQDSHKYPITLNMPFKTCMDAVLRLSGIDGAVINPFSHNIIINVDRNQADAGIDGEDAEAEEETEEEAVELTEEQFHALVRQQMESTLLPGRIFSEGETFINDLCRRTGECLIEFFKEPYAQIECPYEADDYDFMTLSISDTLQLTRISMPYENLYPGTAETLFITWNPEKKTAGYYGILKGARGEFNKLMEVTSEGKAIDHGVAPDEGNELQTIIDIASE